jgi:hypothetical protein
MDRLGLPRADDGDDFRARIMVLDGLSPSAPPREPNGVPQEASFGPARLKAGYRSIGNILPNIVESVSAVKGCFKKNPGTGAGIRGQREAAAWQSFS